MGGIGCGILGVGGFLNGFVLGRPLAVPGVCLSYMA